MFRNTIFTRTRRRLAVTVAGAILVVGGTGAAVAATSPSTPSEESKAVIAAAATDLGISSEKLTAALKAAMVKRIDAAVAAGTLTAERATELKARIASGEVPLVGLGGGHRGGPGGGPGHGGHLRFGGLEAAAAYLGMTEEALHTAAETKSLAAIAKEKGKAVEGLVGALVAAAKADLADAVTAGRITAAQQTEILATLNARITEHVNRVGRPRHP